MLGEGSDPGGTVVVIRNGTYPVVDVTVVLWPEISNGVSLLHFYFLCNLSIVFAELDN